ncbi:acetoacetate--CoA ligase [Rhodococcus sp. IEGM 1241]|uniref:acetoacetate--CoA ligase n=1 Tax=Rhodococcus sp. IEGM 1241 TaxID=3082228 RepID=UPI0029558306|nr:acetoacetate--CoA ligase [Rhodococcus sp. IEGM 1241]MDV8015353.1 acetoacetate--CoA ligase [Rhodococcus sp. IEGM 1241]
MEGQFALIEYKDVASSPTSKSGFEAAEIGRFATWASKRTNATLVDYPGLWRWSVEKQEEFWASIWDYFDLKASVSYDRILGSTQMPGAQWLPGARLNYVDQVLRHGSRPGTAVVSVAEDGTRCETSWRELTDAIHGFAATLQSLGVKPGDRVVGYLTNSIEPIIAFLGTAAIGAVWSGIGPDYGIDAAAARLTQLEPSVLVAVTGYQFNGTVYDRRAEVAALAAKLGHNLPVIIAERAGLVFDPTTTDGPLIAWQEAIEPRKSTDASSTLQVPADHPLWILFSSGTTGVPKGIVHGHGGILLEHMASLGLQYGAEPESVFFWYTTTNWMMWNLVVSALLTGATTVTYEGSPGFPTLDRLWQIAGDEKATMFGTSPGHLQYTANAQLAPGQNHDLSRLQHIGVTGSPVAPHLYDWVAEHVGPDLPLVSTSGGTDVCSSFVGWSPGMPIYPGEIATASLGVAVDVYDAEGNPTIDEVGELVVTKPMPSMPVSFWDDPDGARYRAAYFDVYPGIWRHGDWMTHTSRGTYIIHGRSDSTLNRGGVRIGSSDLYAVVEAMPEVVEALVLGVELPNATYWMPMFLVLTDDVVLDDPLVERIRRKLRDEASPRHIPDEFFVVPALPHTRTGKRLEVPLKRILQGADPAAVVSLGAVDKPELIDFYTEMARTRS